MLKKRINSSLSQHILHVDLIQKYKFQNKNKIPYIKEVCFLLDLNDSTNLINISEEMTQIYNFFNLYSFSLRSPKVQIYKHEKIIPSSKGFRLKFSIKNRADIEMFLEYIFLYLIEKQDDVQKLRIKKWESNIDLFIPLTRNINIGLNQKFFFNINISFNFNEKEKSLNFFSQFPPFWILRLNG